MKTGLKLIMPITWMIVLVLTVLCTVELYIVMVTCDFCMDPETALLSELDEDRYDCHTSLIDTSLDLTNFPIFYFFSFRFLCVSLFLPFFSSCRSFFFVFLFVAPFTPR